MFSSVLHIVHMFVHISYVNEIVTKYSISFYYDDAVGFREVDF